MKNEQCSLSAQPDFGLNWRHMLYKLTTGGQLEINRWPWSSSHRTGVIGTEKLN